MKIPTILLLAIMTSTVCASSEPTIIFKKTPKKNNDHGSATNYARRFAFLPDSSPFKQACSTVNENKEVNSACVALSNLLYCAQHPHRMDRPEECQAFCDNLLADSTPRARFKEILLSLQNELLLDPKEVIDFMRALTKEAEAHEASDLCSKNKTNWNANGPSEQQEILYC